MHFAPDVSQASSRSASPGKASSGASFLQKRTLELAYVKVMANFSVRPSGLFATRTTKTRTTTDQKGANDHDHSREANPGPVGWLPLAVLVLHLRRRPQTG